MYHEPMPPDRVRARRLQIADAIRAARVAAGLTLEAVSLRTGIRIATLSEIEQGHSSPQLDTLIRVADGIGVELEEFVRR
ncbi:helix-turn-helix transcriptional regulator [Streptomyces sp. MBT56]|nr:helix-turn-helix transcriptional regulator [Streptomyces sp. MBT56]MBK3601217.1 helix-turn-helix transcriptional regulator [Streptomyces sp. MBT54]MBK3614547.1 helix-turn-helix transcriptional regulator [Streptomyces sp. MBT98]MBK6042808.1 helix-turn-helix transcriptional regulator [Streptomyces sp. MBT55]